MDGSRTNLTITAVLCFTIFVALGLSIAAFVEAKKKVGNSNLEDGSVRTHNIENESITSEKLAALSVTSSALVPNSVNSDKISNDDSYTIKDLTITRNLLRYNINTVSLQADDRTLTSLDSGSLFLIPAGEDYAITLPSVSGNEGWNVRFVLKGALDGNTITITQDTGDDVNLMRGNILSSDGEAGSSTIGADEIKFGNNSAQGDFVDLFTDGTHWYVKGVSRTPTITFA